MTQIIASEGTGAAWAEVSAGAHPATIVGYEYQGQSNFNPDVRRCRIEFALEDMQDDEGKPVVIHQYINEKLSPKTDLGKLFRALGIQVVGGQSYDPAEVLVGRAVTVITVREERDDGTFRPKIVETMPRKEAGAKTGLVSNLKGSPGVKPAGDDVCRKKGCLGATDKFTAKGIPLCAVHTAEDLLEDLT